MAVKSKTQLASDIAGSTFSAPQQVILDDMVDIYQDLAIQLTTAQRNAIATPANGLLIYNTDNSQFEYYNGSAWATMSSGLGSTQSVTVAISSAQILAGNTTPVQLIASAGAGLAIIPISAVVKYTYITAAYATNTTQSIYFDTLDIEDNRLISISTILEQTANKSAIVSASSPTNGNSIIANKALMWAIQSGNPTAGSGRLDITVIYTTIPY
jgi:hypothetical protein